MIPLVGFVGMFFNGLLPELYDLFGALVPHFLTARSRDDRLSRFFAGAADVRSSEIHSIAGPL